MIAPAAEWDKVVGRLKAEAPEAFLSDGRLLNLIEGEWQEPGFGRHYTSAVDGPRSNWTKGGDGFRFVWKASARRGN
jgi:hypothetical protein